MRGSVTIKAVIYICWALAKHDLMFIVARATWGSAQLIGVCDQVTNTSLVHMTCHECHRVWVCTSTKAKTAAFPCCFTHFAAPPNPNSIPNKYPWLLMHLLCHLVEHLPALIPCCMPGCFAHAGQLSLRYCNGLGCVGYNGAAHRSPRLHSI
jgi:hypothetical protein